MTVDRQFNIVSEKLQQLLKQHARIRKENERLSAELNQARLREQQLMEQLDMMQQQTAILKSAAGQLPEAEKKEFEKKISQYIKDIDNCIAYLSQ